MKNIDINAYQSIQLDYKSIKIVPRTYKVQSSTQTIKKDHIRPVLGVLPISPNFHLRIGIPIELLTFMIDETDQDIMLSLVNEHNNMEIYKIKNIISNQTIGTILVYKGFIIKFFISHDDKDKLGFSLKRIKLPNNPIEACNLAVKIVKTYTGNDNPYLNYENTRIFVKVPDLMQFKGKHSLIYAFRLSKTGGYEFDSVGYDIKQFSDVDANERWERNEDWT